MSEYIDRQAASDALARLCKRVCQYSEKQRKYMCGACPLGDAFTVIEDDLPAADVRPVVKGRWELDSDPGEPWRYVCNICGEKTKDTVMGKPRANFCPYCGADMREES